jgi:ABC-type transport system involved in cytochrome c biogenesis permease subunit
VLCITAGYGACILAACLAHACLYLRWRRKNYEAVVKLQPLLHYITLIALLLTAIGTILGGIWADQSWGRFWGWDPKENGALLIVLWLVWSQHGRLSGDLNPLFFTAATAFLNVIVALAWFGVNLLNVGLHSYGFITGIAGALAAFCIIEILIIGALVFLTLDKERHTHVA